MFDRLKEIISDPGSIQDKLGNLAEEVTGGSNLHEQFTGETVQEQVSSFGGLGAISEQLNGVEFPIGRDDLATVLEGRGVPTLITDRLHNLDISQFASRDDVLGRISGLMR